jgi:cyanophycinase-like exopeptidase
VAALAQADYIFAGPGSPTYAVRQLRDTQTWTAMQARHAAGATLAFASAAAIAMGHWVLPVYEIYKAGADLSWGRGLDLLWGSELAIMPHWNNAEGGAGLDTTCCFMGAERFAALRALLPPTATVLGIDEHTACILDPAGGTCQVLGAGGVTILQGARETIYPSGSSFPLADLAGTAQLPAGVGALR